MAKGVLVMGALFRGKRNPDATGTTSRSGAFCPKADFLAEIAPEPSLALLRNIRKFRLAVVLGGVLAAVLSAVLGGVFPSILIPHGRAVCQFCLSDVMPMVSTHQTSGVRKKMFGFKKSPKTPLQTVPRVEPHAGPIGHVHFIDTSVASDNVGDEIIVEAVRAALKPLFGGCYVSTSSGHDGLGPFGRELVAGADLAILMGTNALSPRDQTAARRFVWTIAPQDRAVLAGKVVLCGVGANRAFETVDPAQRALLSQVLSRHYRHSVRDGLGLEVLRQCRIDGINTSCPTLWRYLDTPVAVPRAKAAAVVFTLTKHRPDPADAVMVQMLKRMYGQVWFWPQQPRDLGYLAEIAGLDGIRVLPANLAAYDAHLASHDVDVVGTRLHGGIRGLSHGRRVLIVAIDNRAAEIGRETGLPVILRQDVALEMGARLRGDWPTALTLPGAGIAAFLAQFQGLDATTT